MTFVKSSPLLRGILMIDAAFSGVSGLSLALGAGPLAGFLGLPTPLVLGAGLFLLPYAALVALLGTRESLPRALVWFVVAGNILWAIESVVLLVSGQASPTSVGIAVVVAQALAVAIIAETQAIGLKRSIALPA